MAYVLTIAGVAIDGSADSHLAPGWALAAPANAIGRLQFEVLSPDGSYVPGRDAEVILTDNGVRIFGGNITTVRERGLADKGVTALVSEVTALDFNAMASRFYFGAVIPAGTLKAALTTLVPFLPGITLDAAQVNGPSLPALNYSDAWLVQAIFDQLATLSSYVWEIDYTKVLRMYTPGSLTAPFNIAAGDGHVYGDVTSEPSVTKYANVIILWGAGVQSIAVDAAEIAAHGQWQLLVKSPDTATQAAADALAAAVLAASLPFAKKVTYDTFETGLLPGQTQTITLPTRHLNNTFLLTDIQARAVGDQTLRSVSAIEGLVFQTGWRETIKSWGGAGGGLTLPGLSGGVANQRFAYFLGGSGLDFVQSATPTWVPASPIQVQVNTIARGTIQALVSARLRALDAGVSVQARIYDVTAATPCAGVSAVITSTAWSIVSFTATLTAGSHYYELQLLPGAANKDVGAVGYLE